MGKTLRSENMPGGVDLAENAVALVRRAGGGPLALYYAGAVPFVTGFVTFVAAMERSANAAEQLPEAALGLALLYAWMKAWQCVYCQRLFALVRGSEAPRVTLTSFWRTAARQVMVQAAGWIAAPASAVAVLPFGTTYAFFQNMTVLDAGEPVPLKDLAQRALKNANVWQKQNLVAMWLLSHFPLMAVLLFYKLLAPALLFSIARGFTPLAELGVGLIQALLSLAFVSLCPAGVVISVNLGLMFFIGVQLLNSFFGIEFSFPSLYFALFDSSYLFLMGMLTYLVLDPVLKAAYVLRCFYAEAYSTGEDLRVQWARSAKTPLARLVFLAFAASVFASGVAHAQAVPPPDPTQLDRAIAQELDNARYEWHLPRESAAVQKEESWFAKMMHRLSDNFAYYRDRLLKALDRWIDSLFPSFKPSPGFLSGSLTTAGLLKLLLAVLVLVLAGAGLFLWRQSILQRRQEDAAVIALAPAAPDLEDENTGAEALPENEWVQLARELMQRGEYRLATRALFLGILALLAERNVLRLSRSKSNRDYAAEVRKRAHVRPEWYGLFRRSAEMYEAVWYGNHEASGPSGCDGLMQTLEALHGRDPQ